MEFTSSATLPFLIDLLPKELRTRISMTAEYYRGVRKCAGLADIKVFY
jgi:hypothetical protein